MELAGIGIAIPGPFDYAAGVSRMTHKFRSICGVDLRGVLHAMPGVPADAEIRFMQDVNAALAGEIARGQRRRIRRPRRSCRSARGWASP